MTYTDNYSDGGGRQVLPWITRVTIASMYALISYIIVLEVRRVNARASSRVTMASMYTLISG